MKIAIIGAGVSGAYLYRLLTSKDHDLDIFDKDPGTRCGITPCAWGTSRGFQELVKAAGLDPSKYILRHLDHVLMDGLKLRADLMTIDKQALVRDLLDGARVSLEQPDTGMYDRIIDATGVSRAYLPRIHEDILLPCVQFRIRTDALLENRIRLGRIGYAWCFPLGDHEYHVGCGSLISDPRKILQDIGWVRGNDSRGDVLCGCRGSVRLASPQGAQPFVVHEDDREVWGVGEAIGCVAPLAGDGIVPGMRSAQLLVNRWNDPSGYAESVLNEFLWMGSERKVIDQLRRGETLGMASAWVLRKNSKRMGMQVRLKDAATLIAHLK